MLDREPPKGLSSAPARRAASSPAPTSTSSATINDEAGALAIVRRGWDTFERLARVKFPTLALIRGFCLGGGLELALACRYRVAIDEPARASDCPRCMLGIVPGWGGIKRLPRLTGAPAALDLLLTGKTVDARRAKKLGIVDEACRVRIMENTARGVLRALPPPRTLALPLSLTLNPLARRFIAAQAEKQVAKRARREHYPAPYAILELLRQVRWQCARRARVGPGVGPALLRKPDGGEPHPRVQAAGAPEEPRQGRRLQGRARARRRRRHHGRRHRRMVRAARAHGDAAGPERRALAPAMKRAGKLFADRLNDPRRVRDVTAVNRPHACPPSTSEPGGTGRGCPTT